VGLPQEKLLYIAVEIADTMKSLGADYCLDEPQAPFVGAVELTLAVQYHLIPVSGLLALLFVF
jgi:hypothetical protein